MQSLSNSLLIILSVLLAQGVFIYLYTSLLKYAQGVPLRGAFNPLKKYTDYYQHPEWVRGYNDCHDKLMEVLNEYEAQNKQKNDKRSLKIAPELNLKNIHLN